jgi:hypothetical protein
MVQPTPPAAEVRHRRIQSLGDLVADLRDPNSAWTTGELEQVKLLGLEAGKRADRAIAIRATVDGSQTS